MILPGMKLFENDGFNWYRIPSLVRTPAGVLIATCDKRKGSCADHGQETDVVMRRSSDGGATWGETAVLAAKPGATLHSGPSLVDRRTGRVFKFYRVAPVMPDHRALFNALRDRRAHWEAWGSGNFAIHSDDDGATWSAPVRVPIEHPDAVQPPRLGNSVHGIQLRNGTLLVQACCHCCAEFAYNADMDSRSFLLVSDDGGASWRTGASWAPGYACMEYTVAETADGRVYVNQRSLGPHRRVAWLEDYCGGKVALRVEPQLPEPVCHAGLERVGDRMVFANPSVENRDRKFQADTRRDLTLRVSRDDGKTWTGAGTIHQGPAGYSDLAALPDGSVACLYECGDARYNDRIDFQVLDAGPGQGV